MSIPPIPIWASQVTDRIRSIAKTINSLELERQQLLSMLWDAGLQNFPVESENVCENVESESPCNKVEPDGALDKQLPAPSFTPPNGFTSVQCAYEDVRDEENIDPRELSFQLPVKADGNGTGLRIFKPEEWKQIDWGKLDQDKLKACMLEFGLKPSGGKGNMISHLKRIFQYIDEDQPGPSPAKEGLSKAEMFEEFGALIQHNNELYEKIILFESVELSTVHSYLETKRDRWRNFSINLVREYLDSVGVQYSNTSANADPRRRPKKRLRKSISCP